MISITFEVIKQLTKLPDKMGVYLFRDEEDSVIFVNTAKSISTQVRSHFHSVKRLDKMIKSKTRKIEYFIKEDKIEAAKLELLLIRKHHPPLNQRGHDQKRYRFIEITSSQKYPSATLRKILNDKKSITTIGPFPKKSTIRAVFNFAVNYFEIADCRQKIVPGKKSKTTATCLRRKTQQCCRPCEIELDLEDYNNKIRNFIRFFDGEFPQILDELEDKMKLAVENFEFEKAALLRDEINAIKRHIKIS